MDETLLRWFLRVRILIAIITTVAMTVYAPLIMGIGSLIIIAFFADPQNVTTGGTIFYWLGWVYIINMLYAYSMRLFCRNRKPLFLIGAMHSVHDDFVKIIKKSHDKVCALWDQV